MESRAQSCISYVSWIHGKLPVAVTIVRETVIRRWTSTSKLVRRHVTKNCVIRKNSAWICAFSPLLCGLLWRTDSLPFLASSRRQLKHLIISWKSFQKREKIPHATSPSWRHRDRGLSKPPPSRKSSSNPPPNLRHLPSTATQTMVHHITDRFPIIPIFLFSMSTDRISLSSKNIIVLNLALHSTNPQVCARTFYPL